MEAFEKLRSAGKIKRWGVSNFDFDDMKELFDICRRLRSPVATTNQVLHNLGNREIEFDLLRLLTRPSRRSGAKADHSSHIIPIMAWVLRQPGVIAIPKASNEEHVRDNARSVEVKLTKKDLVALDQEFPPPQTKQPLAML